MDSIVATNKLADYLEGRIKNFPKDGHDIVFKEILTVYFKDFIEMFLPKLSDQLDFKNLTFLDKEMFHHGTSRSKNYLDLVCKAPMLDKDENTKLILVHIEVQSTKDNKMVERMLDYYCHLRIKHHLDVVPIVLFADDAKWRREVKNSYDMNFNDKNYLHFEYEQIKLKNLDVRDYLDSTKPLAYALMAKMDISHVDKKKLMVQIARFISNGQISKDKQALLYTICYKYLILNSEDKEVFNDSLEGVSLEEKGKIGEIMMNFERKIGYEEGLNQGFEGQYNMLISLVEKGALAVDVARAQFETLKDKLPKELYEKGLKKLQ